MIESAAAFSPCRTWRYALTRIWQPRQRNLVVIGLNPSTADETVDDPTIRRCIRFAMREKCGGLLMLNLFAFRATDPKVMLAATDPVGPENDHFFQTTIGLRDTVVAAWGVRGAHRGRDREAMAILPLLRCFGVTKSGHPKHPLYLRADTPLVPFRP